MQGACPLGYYTIANDHYACLTCQHDAAAYVWMALGNVKACCFFVGIPSSILSNRYCFLKLSEQGFSASADCLQTISQGQHSTESLTACQTFETSGS